MKYFSTSSAHMTLVRKDGYYMSDRTASRVAKKLAVVLDGTERSDSVKIRRIATMLSCGMGDHTWERQQGFTPAEIATVRDLSAWFSFDESSDGFVPFRACYVAINLNSGFSLVISERKPSTTPQGTLEAEQPMSAEERLQKMKELLAETELLDRALMSDYLTETSRKIILGT